jgi:uncharacterized protein (TIGR02466 family)
MEKTNEGGWHSQDDLHEDDRFATLKSEIINLGQDALNHLAVEDHLIPELSGMWAVVNGPGSSNKLHTHPFNYLSGVFYLQVPPDSGPLVFWDPRPQSDVLLPPKKPEESIHISNRVSWAPKSNDLILFPSWLSHEVEKNNSTEERIVLSFNLELKRRLNG